MENHHFSWENSLFLWPFSIVFSRKLASASWSLLALASIGGAAQGHHVIFHAKGPPSSTTTITTITTIIIIIIHLHFIIIGNYWHYHES